MEKHKKLEGVITDALRTEFRQNPRLILKGYRISEEFYSAHFGETLSPSQYLGNLGFEKQEITLLLKGVGFA